MVGKRRGYKLPKALCIGDRTHKVINYEGHRRIIIQQRTWWSTKDLIWVSILNQKRKECKCNRLWKHLNNSQLKCKGIMISKTKDQKQTFWSRMDQLNIPEAQSMTDSLVENQLMFKMTSEPEGWILGSIWGLRESATYWINRLKMIMTRYAIKITRLMGLIILQASKNFKSKRLQRIFGRSNSILKTFVKHVNNWGWADTRQVRGFIRKGIHVAKNC